jgi:hypothetical protein
VAGYPLHCFGLPLCHLSLALDFCENAYLISFQVNALFRVKVQQKAASRQYAAFASGVLPPTFVFF